MKFALTFSLAVMMGVSAQAAIACTPAHQFKTVTPNKLTVATMIIPPFVIPQGKNLAGVDGDLITKIAEMECLEIEPMVVDTRAVMQHVISGHADIAVGNWFRTAARAQSMGMSDPIYLDSLAIFSKSGADSLDELAKSGKVVGTVQGYNWVADLKNMFGSRIKLYPNPVALTQDLEAGRIEAGLDSYSGGIYAQQQGALQGFKVSHAKPDERVKASIDAAQIAFTFAKGNTTLEKAMNENIAKLRSDATIGKTLEKYGLSPQDGDVGTPRLID